jgi:glycosyltransferase involved in cell wall biosynthesis
MPLFSVILTACNRAQLLKRALRSLYSQSFKDWELVLVIDGQDFEVLDMAARLGDTGGVKVKFVPLPESVVAPDSHSVGGACLPSPRIKRVAVAVNLGLDVASGEWITYLCDDDEYLPGRFEHYLPHLSLADAIAGNAQFVRLNGAVMHQNKFRFNYPAPEVPGHLELLDVIRPGNFICHDSIAHRATKLRWPTDIQPTPNDWRYWVALHRSGFRFRRIEAVGERALMPGTWREGNPTQEKVLSLAGECLGGGKVSSYIRYAKNVSGKRQNVSNGSGGSVKVYPGERVDAALVSYQSSDGKWSLFPGFSFCGDFSFPETLEDLKSKRASITQTRRVAVEKQEQGQEPTQQRRVPEEELPPQPVTRPRTFEPIAPIKGGTVLTESNREPKHPFDID